MTDTPTRPRKTTLSQPTQLWGQARGARISMRCSAPGVVHVDFLEDDVDRHEHRTKAMGPARRTARRV
jgi:hypothetical protein